MNGAVVVGAGYSGQVSNITCFGYLKVELHREYLFIGSEARLCTSKNGKEELLLLGLPSVKEGLYRIWCGVNTLGDSGVNTLGDTSAFVNPMVQLLLTRRGNIRMDGVGIYLNSIEHLFKTNYF